MTTESIQIVITEDGSRNVTVNISGIGNAANKSAGQVDLLNKAVGGLAGVLAIDEIIKYADAWNSAAGLISVATSSAAEATAVQEKLFQAAQDTRQSYDSLVDLYRRAALAADTLGASQNQLIQVTKEVAETLVIQHTTAEAASGALLQLGHALDGGKVNAREFNSINLTLGPLLKAVAQNVVGAGGTIQGLRAIMTAGGLTSKAFFDGIQKSSAILETEFAKSATTIGQSFTVIGNAFEKFIGQLNESEGLGAAFNTVANLIAANMKQLASALVAVGAAVLVAFAPGAIEAFYANVVRLFILINTNPFVALASAIAAAVTYFHLFGDEMNAGVDSITTYNDIFRALWDNIKQGVGEVLPLLQSIVTDVFDGVGLKSVTNWFSTVTSGLNGGRTGFAGFLTTVATVVDAIAGLLTGLGIGIGRVFTGVPDLVKNAFNTAYNFVLQIVEDMINEVIGAFNKLRTLFNEQPIELVKFDKADVDTQALSKYGANIADSIADGFATQGGYVQGKLTALLGQAQAGAAARLGAANNNPPPAVNLDAAGTPSAVAPDQKKIDAATNALRSLENTVNPAAGAMLDYAHAVKTVNNAIKLVPGFDGIQALALLGDVKKHYQDLVDPIGAISRGIQDQNTVLQFNTDEQQVQQQVLTATNDLRKKGVVAVGDTVVALTAEYTQLQKNQQLNATENTLLADSVQKRKQFTTQISAMNALLANPNSGYTQGDLAQTLTAQYPDILVGTKTFTDANTALYKNMYDQINTLQANKLISDQTAEQARQNIAIQSQAVQVKAQSDFFGNLATLSQLGNKKLAAIGKAAAIAQASIDGYAAIQKAYSSAPFPYDLPAVAAVTIATAANVAKIAGFESGGYTGSGGTSSVAGVVHGQEFVVNADGTSKNRAVLEAMNSGATVTGGSNGQTPVNIVINTPQGTTASTKKTQTPTSTDIEVMITQTVAKDFATGGKISRTVEQQYGVNRAVGTPR